MLKSVRPLHYCCILALLLVIGATIAYRHSAKVRKAPTAALSDSSYPAKKWGKLTPARAHLHPRKLDALAQLVGGAGFVSRHGQQVYSWGPIKSRRYIASAMKPLISTLLCCAIQEKRLPGFDAPLSVQDQRLVGKNAGITWRHLANMTSGYGLPESPGTAFGYNDLAIALYYDTLMEKVFAEDGTSVLHSRLAEPLRFQDKTNFVTNNTQGKLAVSARDLARFGLLILRGGQWQGRQLIDPQLLREMLHTPLPASTPLTTGLPTDMLPAQRTIGGERNDSLIGPGIYSFNWWLNLPNAAGQRPIPPAPPDTILASGLWGRATLWIIPSLDLVVTWNKSPICDQRESPTDPSTLLNKAATLITQSVIP